MQYAPGKTVSLELCVDTKGATDYVAFEPQGPWAQYITIDQGPFKVVGIQCFTYKLSMPESTEYQGMLESRILVKQMPPEEGQMIGYSFTIVHQIRVYIPYKGPYLEASINVPNLKKGQPVPLTLKLDNKGTETVDEATTEIKIEDPDGAIAHTFLTTENSILSGQTRTISKTIPALTNPGVYKAIVNITYGTKNVNTQTKFKVGQLDVIMTGHTSEVIKGGIREFQVTVESLWPEEIPNVRANVKVNVANDTEEITTFSFPLAPWKKYTLLGYLNTEDLPLGTWPVDITIQFEGGTHNYTSNVTVLSAPEEQKPESTSTMSSTRILVAGIGLIVILLAVVIILLVRRK
ncbi:MAG: hypothetical protein ABIA93_04845 [Candidatus Woesearchaeota archaeon]